MITPAIIHKPWVHISVVGFLKESSFLGSSYLPEAGCHLPIQKFPMALQVLWEQNQNSLIETTKILLQHNLSDFHYSPFLYLLD